MMTQVWRVDWWQVEHLVHACHPHQYTVYVVIFEYHIARNVGGGKHWQIPLKTASAKKILANASLTSNEMLLTKMMAIIDTFAMYKLSITPYMCPTCTWRCFRCEFFYFSIHQLNRLCRYLLAERTNQIRQR